MMPRRRSRPSRAPAGRGRRGAARSRARACRACWSRPGASRPPWRMACTAAGAPGTGETFWQFRPFTCRRGRRSGSTGAARARDDHLFVREQEWEAAAYASGSGATARPRWAFLVARPGLQGRARAWCSASRWPTSWCAAASASAMLGADAAARPRPFVETARPMPSPPTADAPPTCRPMAPLPRAARGRADRRLPRPRPTRARSASAHSARVARAAMCCMIVDPVEETLPFNGRALLVDLERPVTLRVDDAGGIRASYLERLARIARASRRLAAAAAGA